MLLLKRYEQSPGFCGPAALVSLLDYYGISKTEAELAVLCGSSPEYGTHPDQIQCCLESLGIAYQAGEGGTWEELARLRREEVPVLLLWHSDLEGPADGHYSVMADSNEESITFMDPQFGDYRTLSKEKFLSQWHDTDPKTGNKINQWYLYVVHRNRR